MSEKFFITITEDAHTSEKSMTGIRFALTALVQDHEVDIFFIGSGVINTVEGQNPTIGHNVGQWLIDLEDADANITACGQCLKDRGLAEKCLLKFVKIGSMGDLVEGASNSTKQLVF